MQLLTDVHCTVLFRSSIQKSSTGTPHMWKQNANDSFFKLIMKTWLKLILSNIIKQLLTVYNTYPADEVQLRKPLRVSIYLF